MSNVFRALLSVGHDEDFEAKDLPEPTAIIPGPEKVEILAKRVQLGQCLWHPHDAKGHFNHFSPYDTKEKRSTALDASRKRHLSKMAKDREAFLKRQRKKIEERVNAKIANRNKVDD